MQAFFPPKSAICALQSSSPAYSYKSFALSHVPLHLTTATCFSPAPADSTPIALATESVTDCPPITQAETGASPFAIALAQPSHPGYPQAPQLAPGSSSLTLSTIGSVFTSNFLLITPSNTANKNPNPASTTAGIKILFINITFLLYANPAKPIKAIDIRPRVIKVIGPPLKASGKSLSSIFSLIEASITKAIRKPTAAAAEFTTVSNKL